MKQTKAAIINDSHEIQSSAHEFFRILLARFHVVGPPGDNVLAIQQLAGLAWEAAEELKNRRIEYVEDQLGIKE